VASAASAIFGPWHPCPACTPEAFSLSSFSVVNLRVAADTVDEEGLQRGHRWQEDATSNLG
jgi:hypothetical protein